MGRYAYFSDGQQHKFWFALQSSGDICDFGGYEDGADMIRWCWDTEDLPIVEKKLREYLNEIKKLGHSYRKIIKDPTWTFEWQKENETLCKLCARINLGFKIRKGIKREDTLSVEAET